MGLEGLGVRSTEFQRVRTADLTDALLSLSTFPLQHQPSSSSGLDYSLAADCFGSGKGCIKSEHDSGPYTLPPTPFSRPCWIFETQRQNLVSYIQPLPTENHDAGQRGSEGPIEPRGQPTKHQRENPRCLLTATGLWASLVRFQAQRDLGGGIGWLGVIGDTSAAHGLKPA